MAELIDLVSRLPKRSSRSVHIVAVDPHLLSHKDHQEALRQFLASLPHETALILDIGGAEVTPEAIATLFFFALDHQDRHGVLEVRNVGRDSFSLLAGLGADRMPMILFTPETSVTCLH